MNELFTGQVPIGNGHRLVAEVSPEHGYLDGIADWMTQQAPVSRPANIDAIRLRLLAMKEEVGARRRLAVAENQVVPLHISDDPLIHSPPKVVAVDLRGRTLILRLDVAPTLRWIQAFKTVNYRTAQMGGEPSDFGFQGKEASLTFRYNDLNGATAQPIVDDFKRFLTYAKDKYQAEIEQELSAKNAAEVSRKAAEIAEEKRRLELQQQIRL
jgi:hypothetical protein